MWQRCALTGVALLLCGAAQANYSFDNPEQYLADAAQWPFWSDVLRLNAADSALLADCVANIEVCPKRYRGVARLIVRARDLEFKDQLRLVNAAKGKASLDLGRLSKSAFTIRVVGVGSDPIKLPAGARFALLTSESPIENFDPTRFKIETRNVAADGALSIQMKGGKLLLVVSGKADE